MNDFVKLALAQIPQYFLDLVEVTTHPKSFLRRKRDGGPDAANKACIFYGVTLLIATVFLAPALPKTEGFEHNALTAAVFQGLMLLMSLIVIRIAWKLVGGQATIRQLFVCTAYLSGPTTFLLLMFFSIGDVLFRFADTGGQAISTGSAMVGAALAFVWATLGWGAYRTVNRVSRLRSAIAYLLSAILAMPVLLIGVLLLGNILFPPA
ncbi:MAG TPA: hypothetical protein VF861_10975 [Telluria sp.]